jgi:hypothetical protein
MFQLDELGGDFGQAWRDDLRLLKAGHDQRRDAGSMRAAEQPAVRAPMRSQGCEAIMHSSDNCVPVISATI